MTCSGQINRDMSHEALLGRTAWGKMLAQTIGQEAMLLIILGSDKDGTLHTPPIF